MNQRRVAITGLGVVAPNALGISQFTEALRARKSGLRHIPTLERLKFACQVAGIPDDVDASLADFLPAADIGCLNSGMKYALLAAREAWLDAGLRPAAPDDPALIDSAAVIASGMGGMDTFAEWVVPQVNALDHRRLGSSAIERVMMSGTSACVGGYLGLGGEVVTLSSACASGAHAIMYGAEMIRAGRATRVLVGGAESFSAHAWAPFDAMRVIARGFNDRPEDASRPLSASSAGFVPACGAGMLILENWDAARQRGARVHAEYLGGAANSGGMRAGGSMTAPSRDGVIRCVRAAVLDARVNPRSIDLINGHLTATMADPLEIANWAQALEIPSRQLPLVNATKSLIGHALGAAGAIESVGLALQLRDGFVHGTRNSDDPHPAIGDAAERVVRQTIDHRIRIAAKSSFGFGDVNCCLFFGDGRN